MLTHNTNAKNVSVPEWTTPSRSGYRFSSSSSGLDLSESPDSKYWRSFSNPPVVCFKTQQRGGSGFSSRLFRCCFSLFWCIFRKYCSVSRSGRLFPLPLFSFSSTDKHRERARTLIISALPSPLSRVWKQTQQTSRLPCSKMHCG